MVKTKWRIQQLQAVVAQALEGGPYNGQDSKRVREVPDTRTIRYYTTIGLVDRPAEMQGRTAFYNRRHALQLVCIKRLQADGLSLADVQRRLAGATTRQLAAIADLPSDFWDRPDIGTAALDSGEASGARQFEPMSAPPAPPRDKFWAQPPSPASSLPTQAPAISATTCVRLPVTDGVSLELQGVDFQKLTDEAIRSLQPILEKLSDELNRLGLVRGDQAHLETSSAAPTAFVNLEQE